jgi:hypothetical protein
MPQAGGTNDFAEVRDVNGNVLAYTSQFGETVLQNGLALGNPFLVGGANATIPASASLVQTNVAVASGGIVLTVPSASASNLTPGHVLVIQDANGNASASNTIAVKTPVGGGKIGAVANNTASTSAASYAFINSAYGSIRLITDGTNWNPF